MLLNIDHNYYVFLKGHLPLLGKNIILIITGYLELARIKLVQNKL